MCVCRLSCFSHVQLFCDPCGTVAHQLPLSTGLVWQEYWSRLPCPSPGNLPDPGIKPTSLMSSALAGRFFTTSTTWEALLSLEVTAFRISLQLIFLGLRHWEIVQLVSYGIQSFYVQSYRLYHTLLIRSQYFI